MEFDRYESVTNSKHSLVMNNWNELFWTEVKLKYFVALNSILIYVRYMKCCRALFSVYFGKWTSFPIGI